MEWLTRQCSPIGPLATNSIPNELTADVSELEINDAIRVSDVVLPEELNEVDPEEALQSELLQGQRWSQGRWKHPKLRIKKWKAKLPKKLTKPRPRIANKLVLRRQQFISTPIRLLIVGWETQKEIRKYPTQRWI